MKHFEYNITDEYLILKIYQHLYNKDEFLFNVIANFLYYITKPYNEDNLAIIKQRIKTMKDEDINNLFDLFRKP